MAGIKIGTFENTDLNVDFEYTWQHNLGTTNVVPLWVDADGVVRNTSEVFTIVNENEITVSTGGAITGTNSIIVMYDNIVSLQGRKLFDLSEALPVDADRIAFGQSEVLAKNITMLDFIQYINDNSAFLTTDKIANDLSGTDIALLQNALQVYSKSIINNVFAQIYKGGNRTLGTLTCNNAFTYTPVTSYNPATKKYVDDKSIVLKQAYYVGDVAGVLDSRTVTFPADLGTSNYIVIGSMRSITTGSVIIPRAHEIVWSTSNLTSSSFQLDMKELTDGIQDVAFDFVVYTL